MVEDTTQPDTPTTTEIPLRRYQRIRMLEERIERLEMALSHISQASDIRRPTIASIAPNQTIIEDFATSNEA